MKSLLILFISLASLLLEAKSLNPAETLRKLSYVLTERPPSADDFARLEGLSDEQLQDFLVERARVYLETEESQQVLIDRVKALFRMRVLDTGFFNAASPNNAFDSTLKRVIQANEPWRNLLLSQDYTISHEISFFSGSDLLFFQFIFYEELQDILFEALANRESNTSMLESSKTSQLSAHTEEQRAQLAGVITTQRFFKRYPTTKVNKDRSRAAALFRVFLCDDMKPVVLTNDEEDNELLKKSLLAAHSGDDQFQSIEDQHGSDPQCMSCHYKLDPMAQVFNGSGAILNAFASHGAVVYKDSLGEEINEPVQGFQELAQALVRQPDFKSCQVRHFWNWIIGRDVPLTREKREELVEIYDRVDGRPRDFITQLIQRPEFTRHQPLQESDIRFSHVRPILQRCDTCHLQEPLAPILGDVYPYTLWDNVSVIEEIIQQTALHIGGQGAKMPPASAGWTLRAREKDRLLAWVKNGARDNDGHIYYTQGEYYESVQQASYIEGFQDELIPTFSHTFRRILARQALPNSLESLYSGFHPSLCSIGVFDVNTLGFPDPVSGLPLFSYFSPNFLFWWMGCLEAAEYAVSSHYSQVFSEWQNNNDLFDDLSLDSSWESLSEEQKRLLFSLVESHIMGTGVLSQEKQETYFNTTETLMSAEEQGLSLADGLLKMAQILLTSESYLSY
jgi:hypothetical protein